MTRLIAVGRLLPWRQADLERWWKDAGSGPLARTWEVRHAADYELISQCCGSAPQQDSERCSACGENTGFQWALPLA